MTSQVSETLQEKDTSEEAKAEVLAEPAETAEKIEEKATEANQTEEATAPQTGSGGQSPALSGGTPTRPADTPASGQQGKSKPKVMLTHNEKYVREPDKHAAAYTKALGSR